MAVKWQKITKNKHLIIWCCMLTWNQCDDIYWKKIIIFSRKVIETKNPLFIFFIINFAFFKKMLSTFSTLEIMLIGFPNNHSGTTHVLYDHFVYAALFGYLLIQSLSLPIRQPHCKIYIIHELWTKKLLYFIYLIYLWHRQSTWD